MSVLDKSMRRVFKGVSWQNKYVKPVIFALDAPDWIMRQASGKEHLPKYSIRVRSDGVTGQLGGNRFDYFGGVTAQLLVDLAGLTPTSKVLEIGCGSGRTALALTKVLEKDNYIGVDVDEPSIRACQKNLLLKNSGFAFAHIDVQNPMYNAQGKSPSTTYQFPFQAESTDVIFLISVFTHMLPEEVSHYIDEISRMLKPGGRCLMSTFLMDYGYDGKIVSFPYGRDRYRLHVETVPEKAVGYDKAFFDERFAAAGLSFRSRSLGNWRAAELADELEELEEPMIEFGQDVLVYEKES
jgi:SAM-dependent methyltransferase